MHIVPPYVISYLSSRWIHQLSTTDAATQAVCQLAAADQQAFQALLKVRIRCQLLRALLRRLKSALKVRHPCGLLRAAGDRLAFSVQSCYARA